MEEEGVEVVKHVRKFDYLVIGLLTISFYIGIIGQYTIINQYIYDRFSRELHFEHDNSTSCSHTNSNNSIIQNQIQSSTAKYNIYGQIASGIPSIIVVIFSGPLSDLYGRKSIILCSWIGVFTATIVNILIVYFTAPLWIYIFGQVLCGLGGNYGAMLSGVFALISDSTNHRTRNLGLIIIEFNLGVSMVVSQALLGKWLHLKEFFWPMFVFGIIFSFSGVMWFFIRETRPRKSFGDTGLLFHMKISIRKMIQVFYLKSKINILLIFCTIAFFIHVINFFGHFSVSTVYLFGSPFCWKSNVLGYYRSISSGVTQLGIFITYFLLRLKVNVILIIELGFLTNIFSKILMAISPLFEKSICDYLVYIASFELFSGAAVSLLRSVSSQLVSQDEYGISFSCVFFCTITFLIYRLNISSGSLFGMMTVVETFGGFFGGIAYSALYDISFTWFYGFTYCVAVFILLIAFMAMVLYFIFEKDSKRKGYQHIVQ